MPFEDPWLREGTSSPLEWVRQQYEQTKNPIHVVRGYQICRELMCAGVDGCATLPEWILEYLDRFASTVQDLFNNHADETRPVPDLPSVLTETLGFKRAGQGVRTDAFTAWAIADRDRHLAMLVDRAKRQRPAESIEDIAFSLTEAKQGSSSTISRARRGQGRSTTSRLSRPGRK